MSPRARTRRLAVVAALPLVASGIVAVGGALTSSASAACQDGGVSWTVSKGGNTLVKRFRGESRYNGTQDNATRTLTAYTESSTSETHSWEAGGGGGIDLGVWSAHVEGKYGRSSTTGVSQGVSESDTFTIRPGYSGWEEAQVHRQTYIVKAYHVIEGCPAQGAKLIGEMAWHDAYVNGAEYTRKGRVGW
ncbi:MAG: hypothetical protein FWE71_02075 [Nocardioidaceae bacterium]|nr:hypothetical protein [Nocardioidaceae bacterium]MCL2613373.1 hypothetical protein [Nocardioidaceae bacterium]